MWMVILVIIVISAALIAGAAWGLYGKFPSKVEGFLVAMAGGALIVSVMAELLEPAAEASSIPIVILSFLSGAVLPWWTCTSTATSAKTAAAAC